MANQFLLMSIICDGCDKPNAEYTLRDGTFVQYLCRECADEIVRKQGFKKVTDGEWVKTG